MKIIAFILLIIFYWLYWELKNVPYYTGPAVYFDCNETSCKGCVEYKVEYKKEES